MKGNNEKCPISNEPAEVLSSTGDYREFDCPSYGRFRISGSALKKIQTRPRRKRSSTQQRCDVQGGEGLPFIRNIAGCERD